MASHSSLAVQSDVGRQIRSNQIQFNLIELNPIKFPLVESVPGFRLDFGARGLLSIAISNDYRRCSELRQEASQPIGSVGNWKY